MLKTATRCGYSGREREFLAGLVRKRRGNSSARRKRDSVEKARARDCGLIPRSNATGAALVFRRRLDLAIALEGAV